MTPDLFVLLLAVLLAVAQLVLYAIFGNLELGPRYTAGPRDTPPPDLSARTGRLKRAFDNHLETLPWFAIAVLVAHVAGTANSVTATAAWVYLISRVLYVPAYVIGFSYVRSLIWAVALFAILVIIAQSFI